MYVHVDVKPYTYMDTFTHTHIVYTRDMWGYNTRETDRVLLQAPELRARTGPPECCSPTAPQSLSCPVRPLW